MRNGRRRRGVPAGRRRACATACASCARTASRTSPPPVALYRPGPMDNIPAYCRLQDRRSPWTSLHPALARGAERDLRHHRLPGTGDADRPDPGGLQPGRSRPAAPRHGQEEEGGDGAAARALHAGAAESGIPADQAGEIFDLVDKFAGYGFNKSHAAAYALVSYQTAWLKANHPVEFFAASMSLDIANTDKLSRLMQEAKRGSASAVLPPDVNRSGAEFLVERNAEDGSRDPLRAGRGEARRRRGHAGLVPSARRRGRSPRSPNSPTGSTRSSSTRCRSRTWPRPVPSTAWRRTGRSWSPAPRSSCAAPKPPPRSASARRSLCSVAPTHGPSRCGCRRCRTGRSWRSCTTRRRRWASTSRRIRSIPTSRCCSGWASRPRPRSGAGQGGRRAAQAGRDGGRSKERPTRTGSRMAWISCPMRRAASR